MGESFQRKQRQRFDHLLDIAYDHVTAPDLVRDVRPEVFVQEFACRAVQGALSIVAGQACRLVLDAEGSMNVCCGNRIIGVIDDADRGTVADVLSAARGQADCIVTRPPTLTACFAIRLRRHEDDDGDK